MQMFLRLLTHLNSELEWVNSEFNVSGKKRLRRFWKWAVFRKEDVKENHTSESILVKHASCYCQVRSALKETNFEIVEAVEYKITRPGVVLPNILPVISKSQTRPALKRTIFDIVEAVQANKSNGNFRSDFQIPEVSTTFSSG